MRSRSRFTIRRSRSQFFIPRHLQPDPDSDSRKIVRTASVKEENVQLGEFLDSYQLYKQLELVCISVLIKLRLMT